MWSGLLLTVLTTIVLTQIFVLIQNLFDLKSKNLIQMVKTSIFQNLLDCTLFEVFESQKHLNGVTDNKNYIHKVWQQDYILQYFLWVHIFSESQTSLNPKNLDKFRTPDLKKLDKN
jgi:hypothetical protein